MNSTFIPRHRAANKSTGNWIGDMHAKASTPGLILNPLYQKKCTRCKRIKPTKGGTMAGKPFWKCADCKPVRK